MDILFTEIKVLLIIIIYMYNKTVAWMVKFLKGVIQRLKRYNNIKELRCNKYYVNININKVFTVVCMLTSLLCPTRVRKQC